MKKLYFVCDCGLGNRKHEGQFKETSVNKDDTCIYCGNYAVAKTPNSSKYLTTMNVFDSVIDDDPFKVHVDLDGYETPYKTDT